MRPDAAARPLQDRFQHLRMVVSRIVGRHVNHLAVWTGPIEHTQEPQARLCIDVLAFDQRELRRLEVHRPIKVQPAPARRVTDYRLVRTGEPAMCQPTLVIG